MSRTIYTGPKYPTKNTSASAMKALSNPKSDFQKSYADREANLKSKYAGLRTSLSAGKEAMGQDFKRAIDRQSAMGGGAGGGASMKMYSKGMGELAKQYGSLEGGVVAEEAGALEQLSGAKASERFAREEAIRAGQQFQDTLAFQKGSFAEQMRYSWNELDENKKTNLVNAAALLKDSELDDNENTRRLYGTIASIYGADRAPNWTSFRQWG